MNIEEGREDMAEMSPIEPIIEFDDAETNPVENEAGPTRLERRQIQS